MVNQESFYNDILESYTYQIIKDMCESANIDATSDEEFFYMFSDSLEDLINEGTKILHSIELN